MIFYDFFASIRFSVRRKQCVYSLPRKLDVTIISDGEHKAQLFIPSSVILGLGSEWTLISGNVEWTGYLFHI